MNPIPSRINLVTLGVEDLARSVAFYTSLGWPLSGPASPEIAFIHTAGPLLALFPFSDLQDDIGLPRTPRGGGFGGITLAVNVETEEAVAACLDDAVAHGATLLKASTKVHWGGVSGYFADPDGYTWEVAFNPFLPFDERGLLSAMPE